ncbi:MAG: hypothetical protein WBV89_04175 [Ilumatobacter sp.]
MDLLTILLIVLVVAAIAAVAFTFVRRRQRSGTILASPDSMHDAPGER